MGGIALIALLTFLVWWFIIRKRRRQYPAENDLAEYSERDRGVEKEGDDDERDRLSEQQQRSNRASAHTVSSVATAGTRSSNFIQIAYIPGVTNRSDAASPEIAPPMPPIPIAGAAHPHSLSGHTSPRQLGGDQFLFMPSDLRPESSYTHVDLDSRSSFAPSNYRGQDAVVESALSAPPPRAAAFKPHQISVRSSRSTLASAAAASPPAAAAWGAAAGAGGPQPGSSIVGRMHQPKQITVTRSASNLRRNNVHEIASSETSGHLPPRAQDPRNLSPHATRRPSRGFVARGGDIAEEEEEEADSEEEEEEAGTRNRLRLIGGGSGGSGASSSRASSAAPRLASPVSAAGHSSWSRASPVSAVGWDEQGRPRDPDGPRSSINRLIHQAAISAYQAPVHTGLGSQRHASGNGGQGGAGAGGGRLWSGETSPFADSYAARTP